MAGDQRQQHLEVALSHKIHVMSGIFTQIYIGDLDGTCRKNTIHGSSVYEKSEVSDER